MALRPHPALVSLLMSADLGGDVILSFLVLFPEIGDWIFLRLLRTLLQLATLPSNWVALPDARLAGLYASGIIAPLLVSPRPVTQEFLFLQELGEVGFYYSLSYRWFDLRDSVCYPLLAVSTVGWGCFSFRQGFRRSFWFDIFRLVFPPPCRFYPYYQAELSLSGRGRVL